MYQNAVEEMRSLPGRDEVLVVGKICWIGGEDLFFTVAIQLGLTLINHHKSRSKNELI